MAVLKENHLVTKQNVLNEIRANNMTLQELRFFCIYLSKINPKDANTRVVRFPISDFQSIMELGRINIGYLKQVTNSLLCKVVNVPNERGGYSGFQLFKECTVDVDEKGEWFVEIDSHDKALPYLFDYKNRYFSYQLWNALRLKSSNQLRMYEILKQYEHIGYRTISIENFKKDLGIGDKEYKRYGDFKKWVLDGCQQALAESTDIKFTYEPYGKKGQGGKILNLKFNISKNTDYVDQLTLDRFIEQNSFSAESEAPQGIYDDRIDFLCGACNDEFSRSEIIVLYDLMVKHLSYTTIHEDLECYDYLSRKYNEMKMQDERKNLKKDKIRNRFAYMKSLMGTE